jgi:predicted dienelactone hydrolase
MRSRNAILYFACGVANTLLAVAIAQNVPLQNPDATSPAQTSTTPELPSPSGPFGIGRTAYEWADVSRSESHSPDPQARRDLMVYLWYPSPRREAETKGKYLPGAGQMNANPDAHSEMKGNFEAFWPLVVSGSITSHAIRNAPVAKTAAPFPVVIFSHGNGGTSFGYTSLIEYLVSHGYVVAAVEHTYTAPAVVFPDGRIVTTYRDPVGSRSPAEAFQQMMKGAGLQINTGAADLIFVMNRLSQLNNENEVDFSLSGRLDLTHVAAMGHSSGGGNAALACELSERFKACLSLDGEMPPIAAFPTNPDSKFFTQPVLLLEIDHSGQQRGFDDAQYAQYLKMKEQQLEKCPAGSYDVTLKSEGLMHGSFSDFPLLMAGGRIKETGLALGNLRLIESYILAFLDRNLKSRMTSPLYSETNHPNAVVKAYGGSAQVVRP